MAELDRIQVLVERAKSGDASAFNAIVQEHSGRLRSFIRSRIREPFRQRLDLDDLVQETFARAHESLGRFHSGEEDAFIGWLAGIAKNVVHRRRGH